MIIIILISFFLRVLLLTRYSYSWSALSASSVGGVVYFLHLWFIFCIFLVTHPTFLLSFSVPREADMKRLEVVLNGIGLNLTWCSPLFSSCNFSSVFCSKASPVSLYIYPSDSPWYSDALWFRLNARAIALTLRISMTRIGCSSSRTRISREYVCFMWWSNSIKVKSKVIGSGLSERRRQCV